MSKQKTRPHVERGHSEEATGTPLTAAEEEASRRPAGVTPGVTPGFLGSGFVGSEELDLYDLYDLDERDAAFNRLKELNPDDFE
ncbi:hypothetical protein [Nonomuraea sp. SYSU D8015]|uniref:hypothetical protein n=1 Tax=Nonomuraea sp. SYSU D8015 TaxID=2593644 RepID=UPI0016606D23|nr:hypothetical protein [Nonomuraea sp. SYSU D8015]